MRWFGGIVGFGSSRVLASVAQALSLVLLARGMQPTRFGLISVYISVVMFMAVASDLGSSSVLLRYARRESPKSDGYSRISSSMQGWVRSAAATGLFLCIGASGIALAVGFLLLGSEEVWWAILAVAVWGAFERTSEMLLSFYIGNLKERSAAINLVSRRLVAVSTQIFLVFLGVDAFLAFTQGLIATILVNVFPVFKWYRSVLSSQPGVFRYPVRESLHYWIASMTSQGRELETPIVAHTAGALAAGFYSVAYKVQRPFVMVGISAAQLFVPRLSRDSSSLRNKIYLVLLSTVFTLAGCAVLSFWIGPVVISIVGEQFVGATSAIRMSLIMSAPVAFSIALGGMAQGLGEYRLVSRIGVIYSLLGIAASFIGANQWGADGAIVLVGIVYSTKYLHLLSFLWRRS